MNEAAKFDTLVLTPFDKTNGVETDYTVNFISPVPVNDGDKLYIKFPKTIKVGKTPPCEIKSDCLLEMECSTEGSRLVASFTSLKAECIN